jgi:hypothetical protein
VKNADFEVLIVQVPSSPCWFINEPEHHKPEIQVPREETTPQHE